MSPQLLKAVMNKWNVLSETRKNKLMRLFLEKNGDFHAQHDWLCYLAEEFKIEEHQLLPTTPGYFEH